MPTNTIKHNTRALLHSFLLALTVIFIQQLGHNVSGNVLSISIFIGCLFLWVEIVINILVAKRHLNQLGMPLVKLTSRIEEVIYHFLIPTILYLCFSGFVLSNNRPSLSLLYFGLIWILYFLIFVNIKAYYEDKYKLEESTHYVFDLCKIVIFFTAVNTLLNWTQTYDLNYFIVVGIVFCLASILTVIILIRKKVITILNISLMLLASLGLGYVTASLTSVLNIPTILIAFYSTLIFYIFNAIFHHALERTLKLNILMEYFLVTVICFLVIFLLS